MNMLENYDPNVEDSMSLISNGKNDYLQKECNFYKNEKNHLEEENSRMKDRMSAMVVEKRELTNQWLQEKNDWQSRLFQLQALNTQIQGTLKKKEKDYDKLQAQLSKLVKDSNRGNKQSMTLTFTLPSSHTNNPTASTSSKTVTGAVSTNLNAIHNQEIQGWKNTVLFYQQTQSDALTKKQQSEASLQLLKQQFAEKEDKYQFIIASTTTQAEEAIQQAKDEAAALIAQSLATYAATSTTTTTTTTTTIAPVEVSEEILRFGEAPSTPMATTTMTSITATKAATMMKTANASLSSNTMSSMITTATMKTPLISRTPAKTPAKTPMLAKTPIAATGTISKKYLLGTPGAAQSISWIVQEVNTEMKKLRSRAEAIPTTARGIATTTTTQTTTTTNTMATTSSHSGHHINAQEEILYLKSQLVEALAVIREQDKLIHDALVGKPSTAQSIPLLLTSSDDYLWDDKDEDAMIDQMLALPAPEEEMFGAGYEWKDSDFLPPASPATHALLSNLGWQSIPREGMEGFLQPQPQQQEETKKKTQSTICVTNNKSKKERPSVKFVTDCFPEHLDF